MTPNIDAPETKGLPLKIVANSLFNKKFNLVRVPIFGPLVGTAEDLQEFIERWKQNQNDPTDDPEYQRIIEEQKRAALAKIADITDSKLVKNEDAFSSDQVYLYPSSPIHNEMLEAISMDQFSNNFELNSDSQEYLGIQVAEDNEEDITEEVQFPEPEDIKQITAQKNAENIAVNGGRVKCFKRKAKRNDFKFDFAQLLCESIDVDEVEECDSGEDASGESNCDEDSEKGQNNRRRKNEKVGEGKLRSKFSDCAECANKQKKCENGSFETRDKNHNVEIRKIAEIRVGEPEGIQKGERIEPEGAENRNEEKIGIENEVKQEGKVEKNIFGNGKLDKLDKVQDKDLIDERRKGQQIGEATAQGDEKEGAQEKADRKRDEDFGKKENPEGESSRKQEADRQVPEEGGKSQERSGNENSGSDEWEDDDFETGDDYVAELDFDETESEEFQDCEEGICVLGRCNQNELFDESLFGEKMCEDVFEICPESVAGSSKTNVEQAAGENDVASSFDTSMLSQNTTLENSVVEHMELDESNQTASSNNQPTVEKSSNGSESVEILSDPSENPSDFLTEQVGTCKIIPTDETLIAEPEPEQQTVSTDFEKTLISTLAREKADTAEKANDNQNVKCGKPDGQKQNAESSMNSEKVKPSTSNTAIVEAPVPQLGSSENGSLGIKLPDNSLANEIVFVDRALIVKLLSFGRTTSEAANPLAYNIVHQIRSQRSRNKILAEKGNDLLRILRKCSKSQARIALNLLRDHLSRIKYLISLKGQYVLAVSREACFYVWDLSEDEFLRIIQFVERIAAEFVTPMAKVRSCEEIIRQANFHASPILVRKLFLSDDTRSKD